MPLDISSNGITEKNKLNSDDVWLILLKVEYSGEMPGYCCLNNEQITWNSLTWEPVIFTLSGLSETKEAEIPMVTLSVTDIARKLLPFIEEHAGGIGAIVTIYIVHSAYLANTTPEFEEEMEIIDTSIDNTYKITFKLGAENLMKLRCPQNRYLKNHCRYDGLNDLRCGYTGSETECNRTLTRCKELGMVARYGGQPGVGSIGVQL